MRRCLLLSSLLAICLTTMAQDYLLPLGGRQQYSVTISARGAEITGICMVKTDGEGSRGAIVNEFGLHALDFTLTVDRSKAKVLNVLPMMDRWYIRRVLRKDLRLLFGATQTGQQKGGRTLTIDSDSTVVMNNERYKLKYSLKRLNNESNEASE